MTTTKTRTTLVLTALLVGLCSHAFAAGGDKGADPQAATPPAAAPGVAAPAAPDPNPPINPAFLGSDKKKDKGDGILDEEEEFDDQADFDVEDGGDGE